MRLPNWTQRLREALRTGTSFSWDEHCCVFAARCVDAVTGSKLEPEIRALFSGAKGAAKHIRSRGGFDEAVSDYLGPPTEGRAARRADICKVGKHAVGVCTGSNVRVLGSEGPHSVPLGHVSKHWRVG